MCVVTAGVLTLGVLPDAVMVPLSLFVCCCNVIEPPQGGCAGSSRNFLRGCEQDEMPMKHCCSHYPLMWSKVLLGGGTWRTGLWTKSQLFREVRGASAARLQQGTAAVQGVSAFSRPCQLICLL